MREKINQFIRRQKLAVLRFLHLCFYKRVYWEILRKDGFLFPELLSLREIYCLFYAN